MKTLNKNLAYHLLQLQKNRTQAIQRRDIIAAIEWRKKEALLRKKWNLTACQKPLVGQCCLF